MGRELETHCVSSPCCFCLFYFSTLLTMTQELSTPTDGQKKSEMCRWFSLSLFSTSKLLMLISE